MNKSNTSLAYFAVTIVAALAVTLLPEVSFALGGISTPNLKVNIGGFGFGIGSGAGSIGDSLCTIVEWFTDGQIGAAIASLAVIFMGIAAFFGKVTWGMAVTTACGIFAIFGSESIINAILPAGFGGCNGIDIGFSI